MGLPALATAESLVIKQQAEMMEVFTDMETANQYTVSLPGGRTLFHVAEQSGGAMAFLTRNFLNAKRPFTMDVRSATGGTGLTLRRPWRWLFSTLEVADASGRALGSIEQRFSVFSKRFSIFDSSGAELAVLHGPLFRPWTFRVLVRGDEVGKISKQWSGLLREAFTDADTFGVHYGPAMNPQLRSLVLAATFLIDFMYFEDRNTKR